MNRLQITEDTFANIFTFQLWLWKSFFGLSHPCNLHQSEFVIIFLIEVFEGTVCSKILFPFSLNPYFKTDVTSFPILFLVKDFQENKMAFLSEQFHQKFLLKDDKKWDIASLSRIRFPIPFYMIHSINIEYAMLF